MIGYITFSTTELRAKNNKQTNKDQKDVFPIKTNECNTLMWIQKHFENKGFF